MVRVLGFPGQLVGEGACVPHLCFGVCVCVGGTIELAQAPWTVALAWHAAGAGSPSGGSWYTVAELSPQLGPAITQPVSRAALVAVHDGARAQVQATTDTAHAWELQRIRMRVPVVCGWWVGGGACCVEPLRQQTCTCRVGIRCVDPTVAPLWAQLALLVVPASCSGSCTEGANRQPDESELLAFHCFQADLWPYCHYTRYRPPPPPARHAPACGQQRHRMGNAHKLLLCRWVHLSSLCISTR